MLTQFIVVHSLESEVTVQTELSCLSVSEYAVLYLQDTIVYLLTVSLFVVPSLSAVVCTAHNAFPLDRVQLFIYFFSFHVNHNSLQLFCTPLRKHCLFMELSQILVFSAISLSFRPPSCHCLLFLFEEQLFLKHLKLSLLFHLSNPPCSPP